jgi:hypothetical protein
MEVDLQLARVSMPSTRIVGGLRGVGDRVAVLIGGCRILVKEVRPRQAVRAGAAELGGVWGASVAEGCSRHVGPRLGAETQLGAR